MFLDSQHKMCFIHIPRTGGSWLGYKMMDYCNGYKGVGNEIYAKDGTKIAVGRHTVLQKIYSFQHQLADDIDTYYKFTVVRHPYTRFVSAFDYFSNITDTADRNNIKTMEDMMSWIEDGANKQHIIPQSHWHDERFDNVYKFEDIEQLNLKYWIPKWTNKDEAFVRHKRRGIQKSTHQFITNQKLKDRIFNFYKKDFYLFEYLR